MLYSLKMETFVDYLSQARALSGLHVLIQLWVWCVEETPNIPWTIVLLKTSELLCLYMYKDQ